MNYSRDEVCLLLMFKAIDIVCGDKTKESIRFQYNFLMKEYNENQALKSALESAVAIRHK